MQSTSPSTSFQDRKGANHEVTWVEGHAMTLEQAIEYALAEKPTDGPEEPLNG